MTVPSASSSRPDGLLAALRDMRLALSLLNRQVGQRLQVNDIDLDCLDVLYRHGPHTPGALARRLGLHLATMTGTLDRLERGGWIRRERASTDRRSVIIHADAVQAQRILQLYAGAETQLRALCADYSDSELGLVTGFLERALQVSLSEETKAASPSPDPAALSSGGQSG